MKRSHEPQEYIPPKGMLSTREDDFIREVINLYEHQSHKEICISKYISSRIDMFSTKQREIFWKVTDETLSKFYRDAYNNKFAPSKTFTKFTNIVISLLSCEDEYLSSKASEYCSERGIEIEEQSNESESQESSSSNSETTLSFQDSDIEALGSLYEYSSSSSE